MTYLKVLLKAVRAQPKIRAEYLNFTALIASHAEGPDSLHGPKVGCPNGWANTSGAPLEMHEEDFDFGFLEEVGQELEICPACEDSIEVIREVTPNITSRSGPRNTPYVSLKDFTATVLALDSITRLDIKAIAEDPASSSLDEMFKIYSGSLRLAAEAEAFPALKDLGAAVEAVAKELAKTFHALAPTEHVQAQLREFAADCMVAAQGVVTKDTPQSRAWLELAEKLEVRRQHMIRDVLEANLWVLAWNTPFPDAGVSQTFTPEKLCTAAWPAVGKTRAMPLEVYAHLEEYYIIPSSTKKPQVIHLDQEPSREQLETVDVLLSDNPNQSLLEVFKTAVAL